jgi:hypothetical protein
MEGHLSAPRRNELMRRRDVLLASPVVLGACVQEGTPQTGIAPTSAPGAGNFDWRAALAEERRAAALLLDPDRAWGLLPQAVREAAARAFPAGEGLGFSQAASAPSGRQRFIPASGLVYASLEQIRVNWEARARLDAAGRRSESPGDEGLVGIAFHVGPLALGFDLLRVELDTHMIGPHPHSTLGHGAHLRPPAHVTTAIDRVDGRLDLTRVGSSLLMESRRQSFSRQSLGPSGPETRRSDRWQVVEAVDESVVWREVLDAGMRSRDAVVRSPPVPDPFEVPNGGHAHLRGPHLRIRHETDGQSAMTELHSQLLGVSRNRLQLRDFSGLSYALNESGRARLQAALSEEVRLYAEAPQRGRQVAEANRAQARAVFQSAFGLWQAGNFTAARNGFVDGLRIDPWNGTAHFYLYDIYRNRIDLSQTVGPRAREAARDLLAARHLRLAAAILPHDSREGIEARTLLSAS